MLDAEFANRFAREWIAAWNAHDIERILSHYTDDFEMSSSLIVERMGEPSGTLKGKAAIRPYWERGLAATPALHFELEAVFTGVRSVALLYLSRTRGRVIEVIEFDEHRRACRGSAHDCNP
jgi:ketosteroid isomerase-like protein